MVQWLAVLALVAWLPAGQGADTAASRAGFLVGCWEITGTRHVRETWQQASDDFLIGTSTTTVNGAMREFEYTRVVSKAGAVTFMAQPNGAPPTAFTLDPASGKDEVIFVNPGHDFPKRVSYRRTGPSTLLAWIDGGAGTKTVEFPYTACR